MDYGSLFVLGLGSYFITGFINNKTRSTILNYITRYNYTIKNGDSKVLDNYSHIYSLSKYINYIPFINIINSGIEGITILNNIDDIFKDLKKQGHLSKLSYDEINAYNETIDKEKMADDIFYSREMFSLKENRIKDISKFEKDRQILDKIKMSSVEDTNKLCLLEILEYNIINNIENINYDKLVEYADFFLDFNYSGYLKVFRLNIHENTFTNETFSKILDEANSIINSDISLELKDEVLVMFYKKIINEIRTNGRGKNNKLDVNIDQKYNINVKSKKKNIRN